MDLYSYFTNPMVKSHVLSNIMDRDWMVDFASTPSFGLGVPCPKVESCDACTRDCPDRITKGATVAETRELNRRPGDAKASKAAVPVFDTRYGWCPGCSGWTRVNMHFCCIICGSLCDHEIMIDTDENAEVADAPDVQN